MKNRIFILFVLVLTAFTFTMLHAQSNKSIEEKLQQLKGEIEKIVISTSEGEVTFEGEEAEEIKNKLSNFYGDKDFILELKDDGSKYEKVFVVKKGDTASNFNWVTTKGDSIGSMITLDEMEGASQAIEVELGDGNKKVTVTKIDENGEETREIYEGDEAEEYLKKLEADDNIKLLQLDEMGGEKEKVRIIIEKLEKK